MNQQNLILLTIFILVVSIGCSSKYINGFVKSNSTVYVYIFDEAKQPVNSACIRFNGTSYGGISDLTGLITLKNPPLGVFSIIITSVNHNPIEDSIQILENQTYFIDTIFMDTAIAGPDSSSIITM